MAKENLKNIFNEKISKDIIYQKVISYQKKNYCLKLAIFIIILFLVSCILINVGNNNQVLNSGDEDIININFMDLASDNTKIGANISEKVNFSCSETSSKDILKYGSNIDDKTVKYSIKNEELLDNVSFPNYLKLEESAVKVNDKYDCIEEIIYSQLKFINDGRDKKLSIMYSMSSLNNLYNQGDVNLKKSQIGAIPLTIWGYNGNYGATFFVNGYYFLVDSTKVLENDFIEILKAIISYLENRTIK